MELGILTAEATDSPGSSALVPWWSFSKTVLAAAALVLVGRRTLDLDVPLAGAPYTLRQLLQHTSGLPDYGSIPEYHAAVAAGDPAWTIDELLRRANASRLLSSPGARFLYSNTGYAFVRQLIERATNADLDAALRTLVFAPLEIHGPFVASSVDAFDRIVWGNRRHYDPRWVYHGCVVGALSSAAMFLDRLLAGDLLASPLKAAMLDAIEPGYGLGLMTGDTPLGRVAGHIGQGPGSTIAVSAFLDLRPPRTIAAAVAEDGPETADTLNAHLQSLAADV